MKRCIACGIEIPEGEYCAACQSRSLFEEPGSALPDCFEWEVPSPPSPLSGKGSPPFGT